MLDPAKKMNYYLLSVWPSPLLPIHLLNFFSRWFGENLEYQVDCSKVYSWFIDLNISIIYQFRISSGLFKSL